MFCKFFLNASDKRRSVLWVHALLLRTGGSKIKREVKWGETEKMPKIMKLAAAFSFLGSLLAGILFLWSRRGIYLTCAVSFGSTAYHLGMRLLVGALYHVKMRNRADYTKRWYQPRPWEEGVYRVLRVKAWKGRLPTYDPRTFSLEHHTWDEIAQAMCQSELVHETSAALSFLPLIFSIWFGSFAQEHI